MALQAIEIRDAGGVTRKVFVDQHDTDYFTQIMKVAFGADDASPTLVTSAAPLPVVQTGTPALPTGAATQATLAALLAQLGTDDAAFAVGTHLLQALGLVYQATVDEIDANDLGVPRMTQRRETLIAADQWTLTLNGTTPTLTGSDILTGASAPAALVSTDFAIRDASAHTFRIPMAAWRRLSVHVRTLTTFDQAATVQVYAGGVNGSTNNPKVMEATVNASTAMTFTIGDGATGVGGTTGASPITGGMHFAVPAVNAGVPYVFLRFVFGVAPTAGELELIVSRNRN